MFAKCLEGTASFFSFENVIQSGLCIDVGGLGCIEGSSFKMRCAESQTSCLETVENILLIKTIG
jgi:hypothetical protein